MIERHSCCHLFHSLFQCKKNQCLLRSVRTLFTIFCDAYNVSCYLMGNTPLISVQKCCFAWIAVNVLKVKMEFIHVCPTLFILSPMKNIHCTTSLYFFSFLSFLSFPFLPYDFFPLFHIYINIFGFSVCKVIFPKAKWRGRGKWWRRKKLLFL
jgi:hypothetical protein